MTVCLAGLADGVGPAVDVNKSLPSPIQTHPARGFGRSKSKCNMDDRGGTGENTEAIESSSNITVPVLPLRARGDHVGYSLSKWLK